MAQDIFSFVLKNFKDVNIKLKLGLFSCFGIYSDIIISITSFWPRLRKFRNSNVMLHIFFTFAQISYQSNSQTPMKIRSVELFKKALLIGFN